MADSRFRTQRCPAHGLALGLCESPSCIGHDPTRVRSDTVVRLNPRKCSACKQTRGDAVYRGITYGKNKRPRFCGPCWGDKLKRDAAIEERATAAALAGARP